MNTDAMHKVVTDTEDGKLTFPDVVRMLLEEGVESYFVDFIRGEDRFYTTNGETHVEKMSLPAGKVAEDFSQPGIVAAIRGAQADQIRYPEFVRQSLRAGVAGYWAFLTGKKVIYFGRRGEFHVEEFPRPKS
jgi:uncharacterized protein YbcV (DUF1398 family)